jgi:hypothetical protein
MAHNVEAVEDDLPCRSGHPCSHRYAPGPAPRDARRRACREAQIYLEQVTVQMPPPLLLGIVVVRQFLRAVLARPQCVLRVLGPHFHALSVDVQVHAGQHPRQLRTHRVLINHGVLRDGFLVRQARYPFRLPMGNPETLEFLPLDLDYGNRLFPMRKEQKM